ncbi:hypothetical protein ACFV1C_00520 [Streptomyces sp. NPDC059605]|uniref:hypothetical protein n=1 Tax=Streptomyces sp. NPDC059605 TaxID=3346882 RepID=UPI0036B76C65
MDQEAMDTRESAPVAPIPVLGDGEPATEWTARRSRTDFVCAVLEYVTVAVPVVLALRMIL